MLHKNLKKLREEYDISAARIAKFMQVEEQDILDWESGEGEPTLQQIHELSELFDVSYQDLLDDERDSNKNRNTTSNQTHNQNTKKAKKKTKKKTKTKHKTKKEKTVEKKRNWPLLVIVLLLLLACGAGGYVYWKYGDDYSIIKNNTYSMDEMVGTFTNETAYQEIESTLSLQSNGTYEITYNDCSLDTTNTGTWKVSKNVLTLLDKDGNQYEFNISSSNKLKFVSSKLGCSIKENDVFTRGSTPSKDEVEQEEPLESNQEDEAESASYITTGQWSGTNSTLNIIKLTKTTATFTLQSYDPNNSQHIASLTNLEGEINGNELTFNFQDDGYGTSGTGTIQFDTSQAILKIMKTQTNEESAWAILDEGILLKQ